jgi:hypothetical protein
MEQSKVYRVVDNSTVILTTTDKIKAALVILDLVNKYKDKPSWFWCDEEILK